MYRIAFFTILLVSLALTSGPAFSRSLYTEELAELSDTLRALMVRAEQSRQDDKAGCLAIRREIDELCKKLHRLEDEATTIDHELQRSGNVPNRQLLLSASISKALDLAASLVGYFLDTHDEVFWSSAVSAAKSARTMLAAQ
jgi:hypothetical protein